MVPVAAFAEEDEGEQRAEERRDGVVGARLGRAEAALRADVGENAQSVGDEPQQQRRGDERRGREALADGGGERDRASFNRRAASPRATGNGQSSQTP